MSFSEIQKSHKEASKHLVAVGKAWTMSRIVVLVSLAVAAEAFVAASPTLAPSRVHTRVRLDGAGSRTSTLSLRATVGQRPSASVNARAHTHTHTQILHSKFSRTHTQTLKHTHTTKTNLRSLAPHSIHTPSLSHSSTRTCTFIHVHGSHSRSLQRSAVLVA